MCCCRPWGTEAVRILIVDGDDANSGYLRKSLQEHGFVVDVASDGVAGGHCAAERAYSLVMVNLQLAGIDGERLIRSLRQRDPGLALLAMTSADRVEDTVSAFSAGADDAIAKPFAFAELLARIGSLLRRTAAQERLSDDRMELADLEVDRSSRRVRRAGQLLALTLQEYSLLCLLMERRGAVLSREFLTDQLWDMNFEGSPKVVDVAVSRLRSKLDDPHELKLLHTVRGIGYRLAIETAPARSNPRAAAWRGNRLVRASTGWRG